MSRKSKADRERFIGRNAIADCHNIVFENVEGFRPGFGRMDVGAVGKMVVRRELHGVVRC